MLASLKDIHATWVCPKDEEYGIYHLREGTMRVVEPDNCIQCSLKDPSGYEDDFEITIRRSPEGFVLMLDYDGEPAVLQFTEYRSSTSSIHVHESARHRVYITMVHA